MRLTLFMCLLPVLFSQSAYMFSSFKNPANVQLVAKLSRRDESFSDAGHGHLLIIILYSRNMSGVVCEYFPPINGTSLVLMLSFRF